ncbi:hypothetical protein [Williamsia deligens]|uniref:HTH cro/C1-type domain-containing protein n=1 Tax=Williamsia deligens TaxID=321325 RepID=A0ABW3GE60_9NOCA|nr:hypothetical protein [Williamsia deligens]
MATAVVRRRLEKGLSKEAAATAAGISSITWKRVEDALPVRDIKLRSVEEALGWQQGTVERIGDGLADARGESLGHDTAYQWQERLQEDAYDDAMSDHAGESSDVIRARVASLVAATVKAAGPAVADDAFVDAVTAQVLRHEKLWIGNRVSDLPFDACLQVADFVLKFESEPRDDAVAAPGDRQSDYDLANRVGPGKSQGAQLRDAQDADAEGPQDDGS